MSAMFTQAIEFVGCHAEGEVGYVIIGGVEQRSGGEPAIRPSISGRAWITGKYQLALDPQDPYPEGYRLSDTWPKLS